MAGGPGRTGHPSAPTEGDTHTARRDGTPDAGPAGQGTESGAEACGVWPCPHPETTAPLTLGHKPGPGHVAPELWPQRWGCEGVWGLWGE